MKMKATRQARMAVVRGIRPSEGLFYNSFKNIKVKFIYFSETPIKYPVHLENTETVNLTLQPKYFVDPFKIIKRRYNHRSWVDIVAIEKEISDCDIVNITDTFYVWNKKAVEIAKKQGKKVVTVIWETIPNHLSRFVPPYSSSINSVVKNTDLFILRSKKAQDFTRSLGIADSKTKIIYKGVETNLFKPVRHKNRQLVNILYVGQLDKSKGVIDLVNAFKLISEKSKNVKLTIAGGGPLERFVSTQSRKLPIDYKGWVDYLGLPKLYQNADIFVSPSREIKIFGIKIWEELFSYTLMEAQACGLPIVATRSGGVSEEVGENNILIEQGDLEGLAKAILSLAKDKKLRERIGEKNRKRAEKYFDIKKQAAATEKAILNLFSHE